MKTAPGNKKVDENWQGKVAVITGASSGIGAATAKRLAREGMRLVLVARRAERLAQLAEEIRQEGGEADVITADLGQEAERNRLYEQVSADYGTTDILVNNAGLGWYGYGADMPWKTAREMLQVNVVAVVQLTLLFLARMRERDTGHIINVGSIAGSIPSQGVAVYSATKSFLDAFTTSLFREMQGTRVRMSVVRAGPVATEFFDTAAKRPAGSRIPAELFGVSAELVAERIWGLLRHPHRVIYVPRLLRVTPWIEFSFGWLMDRLGPLHLRRRSLNP